MRSMRLLLVTSNYLYLWRLASLPAHFLPLNARLLLVDLSSFFCSASNSEKHKVYGFVASLIYGHPFKSLLLLLTLVRIVFPRIKLCLWPSLPRIFGLSSSEHYCGTRLVSACPTQSFANSRIRIVVRAWPHYYTGGALSSCCRLEISRLVWVSQRQPLLFLVYLFNRAGHRLPC